MKFSSIAIACLTLAGAAASTSAWADKASLLRATGNPPIAALVAERFHAEFVAPLAKMLRGRDAELRATVIASYVIGLATMRHGLDAAALAGGAGRKKAAATVGEAIQACVA